ncbi:hypothetical protein [Frigoriglobus tundricola]|uniref:Uncharacterized protein n=1 Tax=Frigoriglobus tundricola TaxID=2774151 RepID=A0A6M5Z3N5_9BACT|nr:hypothetical protein [Frigoriglobus tundricola]QJX00716.1 hypothetical protein FTUN_8348 [Frigoriglobus tundricola]
MRHFANVPSLLLSLAAIGTAAVIAAPERTRAAGLDFWNVTDDEALLRAEASQRQDLEFEHEQIRERNAIGNEIARKFCDERSSFREALDAAADLAESSPEWFEKLKSHYRICLRFPEATSNGAVMARYLRVKIAQMLLSAEILGDRPRVAVLSSRLAHFDHEVAVRFPSTPAP